MATKHYTATHEGRTFTRSTKSRTYTHAVIVPGSVKADLARLLERVRESWKMNLAYNRQLVAGTVERYSFHSAEEHAARLEKHRTDGTAASAQAWLALGLEGHLEAEAARFKARVADGSLGMMLDADGDTYYSCTGWAGRPDLAAKEAAKHGGVAVPAVLK